MLTLADIVRVVIRKKTIKSTGSVVVTAHLLIQAVYQVLQELFGICNNSISSKVVGFVDTTL